MEENGDKIMLAEKTQVGDILQELTSVSKDLQEFKREMQKTFNDFQADLRKDVGEELITFKQNINQKLEETPTTLQTHGEAISEPQTRISELEASGPVAKDVLLLLLNQHSQLQEKLTDLEKRSRRNNIRLYGIQENTEGTSMADFVNNLLTTELTLPDRVNLEIQRALVAKPDLNSPPRSAIMNFL